MIGQTISQYRIIEQLGEGGMGVVYLAEDITLGRRVAMKFLSSTTKDYRARFLREARAVSALTHPNIATVFNYGETPDGQPYIVMELVKGQPLNEKLREGSLPLPEAVRIVSAIAEALGEAHHQGVVHRDVKPSNVVITERGQVKVLDFGLVKQIADQHNLAGDPNQKTLPSTRTRSDVIVGTPMYLSPEQATGKNVDGRSDLFALGVVLYECIAGQSAFAGGSVIEIGAQVIHVTPVLPSKLNDRIPPELDRITMKAIEKKVEARYQTADELIADLQQVLPTLTDDGYRKGRSTESLRKPDTHSASAFTTMIEPLRRPRLSLGTVIVVVLAMALVGFGVWKWWWKAAYVPTPEALDWYNKGTDALRNNAFLQASKSFGQAIDADPKFPLAHARLAEARFELDYADKAKDEMLTVQSLVPDRSRLPRVDALYLEAINETVTRDFPGAIRSYREIANLSPDDPQAYVDLGRAYEKNDEIKKAIESYVEAAKRGQQYATPFLRVAVLYGDQLDSDKANAHFDRAQSIFEALGNFEGQAEVAYQRGALFDRANKYSVARPHLEHALRLATDTKNLYQEVKTRLKLGNVTIGEGQVDEGRDLIRKAIDLAQANSIDNQVKRGLVDMGNSYMAQTDYVEAEQYYRQSLGLAQQQKDNRNAARALLSLGAALQRQSKTDEALQCIEQALPFYQLSGYRKEALQGLVVLTRIKTQKGEYSSALEVLDKELKIAKELDDPSLLIPVEGDIGGTLVTLGRFTEALPHFDAALAIATTQRSDHDIGLGLINRAGVLALLGRNDEARALLAQAEPLTRQPKPAKNMMALFHLTFARIALSESNWPEAKSRSQQAMTFAGTTLKGAATESNYILGLAQVFSGASASGLASCNSALTIANASGNPSFKADALLGQAQALLRTGDHAAAFRAALESQELCAHLGRPQNEWLALVVGALANSKSGDDAQTRDYATRAENLLAGLQERWGTDNYNSYLKRQDIQFYQVQLSKLHPRP